MNKKLSVRNVMCSDSLALRCFKQNDKKDIRLREKTVFSSLICDFREQLLSEFMVSSGSFKFYWIQYGIHFADYGPS